MSTKFDDDYVTSSRSFSRLENVQEYVSSDKKLSATAVGTPYNPPSAVSAPYTVNPAAASVYRTPSTSGGYVPQRNGRLVDTIRGIDNV